MCVVTAAICRIVVLYLVLNSQINSDKTLRTSIRDFMLGSTKYYINFRRAETESEAKTENTESTAPNATTTGTTQIGRPKLSENFNPSIGYDPYWPGGHWVFQKLLTTTPKQNGTLCGNVCPDIYRMYGPVCGRNLSHSHTTFPDYCALVNHDCLGREKWAIAYRGECKHLTLFSNKSSLYVSRAVKYIYELEYRIQHNESMPTPAPNASYTKK